MRLLIFAVILTFGGVALADEPNFLKNIFDRSDLIIDATFNENCEGGVGSGPIPNGKPQLRFMDCIIHVTVNRVIKGSIQSDKSLIVSITMPQPDLLAIKATKVNGPIFPVDVGPSTPYLKKGDRCILFLEDRPKREPASHHAYGNEVIKFRNFDLWLWRMAVSDALNIQLDLWASQKMPEN